MAREAAAAAEEKKAANIVVLDLRPVTPIADYFVICSASNVTQARAVADHIEERLDRREVGKRHREGYDTGRWILLDYGDVVVHVFHEHERDYYNLERLWGDAAIVPLPAR